MPLATNTLSLVGAAAMLSSAALMTFVGHAADALIWPLLGIGITASCVVASRSRRQERRGRESAR